MKQIIWIINCYLYGATLILLAVLALLVYLRGQANHLPNPFARRNIVYRPKEKAQGVLLWTRRQESLLTTSANWVSSLCRWGCW